MLQEASLHASRWRAADGNTSGSVVAATDGLLAVHQW